MARPTRNTEEREEEKLRLQRMETRLVDGLFEHPGIVTRARENQLRYAIGLAQIDVFQPRAARRGRRGAGPDVRVRSGRLDRFRAELLGEFGDVLLQEKDSRKRVALASSVLEPLLPRLEATRADLIERYANDFSAQHLDQEVGVKTLVSIAGGGGGSGWVYLGAWEVLQNAGLVPAYLVGASMGAVLGLFRAASREVDFDVYSRIAKSLDPEQIFRYVSLKTRFGFPGIARLYLSTAIGEHFEHEKGRSAGEAMKLSDLAIPFDAVVAGIRRGALDETPEQYATSHHLHEDQRPGPFELRAAIATQLVRLMQFVNPRVVKEIVLGSTEETASFDAVDAVGFSAAIPGLLHYDMTRDDPRMDGLLTALLEREEVVALVDGGVANNVPVGPAWRQVQSGRIGTRNAYYLAFDSLHPQRSLGHFWMQPLTRALALQVAPNDRYAHRRIPFEPTLSPINLLPSPRHLDRAFSWGRQQMSAELPRIQKFFERVRWIAPRSS